MRNEYKRKACIIADIYSVRVALEPFTVRLTYSK